MVNIKTNTVGHQDWHFSQRLLSFTELRSVHYVFENEHLPPLNGLPWLHVCNVNAYVVAQNFFCSFL